MFALLAMLTIATSVKAMSYEQARREALFLTDKMAYELNLNDAQYEAAYEINLDYLMGVTSRDDVYGPYWTRRNLDLSYILLDWQWSAFQAATYFYRPLYWSAGCWHFGVYGRYHRTYFYFSHPTVYVSYRGGHSWRSNGGRSYYYDRRHDFHHGDRHYGMRDRKDNGTYRGTANHSTNGRHDKDNRDNGFRDNGGHNSGNHGSNNHGSSNSNREIGVDRNTGREGQSSSTRITANRAGASRVGERVGERIGDGGYTVTRPNSTVHRTNSGSTTTTTRPSGITSRSSSRQGVIHSSGSSSISRPSTSISRPSSSISRPSTVSRPSTSISRPSSSSVTRSSSTSGISRGGGSSSRGGGFSGKR